MAKNTGQTIAGVRDVTGCPLAVSLTRRGCLLLAVLLGSLSGSLSGWVHQASGGPPAGKSNYRSASHGGTSPDSDHDVGNAPATTGVFGLRSLIPGKSSDRSSAEESLLAAVPMERLTSQAKQTLGAITDKPTLYRRLPTQAIRCDEELFLFLTRKPEAIIGIWDLMGITNVQATRIGPYELDAADGCGTSCKIDLIYGDSNLHVFVADGMYDGKFTQNPIRGRGVFVFSSSYAKSSDGATTVTGTLDCFIKFESLGADLVARSLGGLIGKSADHNFIETARFISQISQASESNPDGMLELIDRMPQVDAQTKNEFARVINNVAQRDAQSKPPTAKLVRERGIIQTQR